MSPLFTLVEGLCSSQFSEKERLRPVFPLKGIVGPGAASI